MRDIKVDLENGFELVFNDSGSVTITKDLESFRQTLAYLLTVDSNKMKSAKEYAFNLHRFRGKPMNEATFDEIRGHTLNILSRLIPRQYIDVQVVIASITTFAIDVMIFIEPGWYPGITSQITMSVRLNLQSAEITLG